MSRTNPGTDRRGAWQGHPAMARSRRGNARLTMAEPTLATTRGVDLATAAKIIDTALGHARSRKLRPMTLAVLDSGGDLVAYKREDGTGIRRYDIVIGKAFGALVMNRPSRAIGAIA